ncbi:hypothetical protein ACWC09_07780 [Streptomyces sp. NPDC001617]
MHAPEQPKIEASASTLPSTPDEYVQGLPNGGDIRVSAIIV